MNILDQQDKLKGLSEQQLVSEMQMPTGQMPQFLVLSEITRRKGLRDEMAAREQRGPQSTVAEEAVAAAGMPQQGLGRMAAAMAPKSDVVGNTGIASLPQAPQAMAAGGRVGGQTYDVPPTAYLRDPAVQALAARMGIRPAQMWDQMSEGQRASEVARLAAQDNNASGLVTREDYNLGVAQPMAMALGQTDFAPNMLQASQAGLEENRAAREDFGERSDAFVGELLRNPEARSDFGRRTDAAVGNFLFPPGASQRMEAFNDGSFPTMPESVDLDLTGPDFEQQGRSSAEPDARAQRRADQIERLTDPEAQAQRLAALGGLFSPTTPVSADRAGRLAGMEAFDDGSFPTMPEGGAPSAMQAQLAAENRAGRLAGMEAFDDGSFPTMPEITAANPPAVIDYSTMTPNQLRAAMLAAETPSLGEGLGALAGRGAGVFRDVGEEVQGGLGTLAARLGFPDAGAFMFDQADATARLSAQRAEESTEAEADRAAKVAEIEAAISGLTPVSPVQDLQRRPEPRPDPAALEAARQTRVANEAAAAPPPPAVTPPPPAVTPPPPAVTPPDPAVTPPVPDTTTDPVAANPAIAAGAGGSGGVAATGGMSSYEQELTNAITRGEKRAQQDKWLALAQAGMALMSSKEPTLGGALGEAGATGLAAFRGSRDSAEESRMKLLEQQFGVQMTRQQMAIARAKAARGGGGLTPLQLLKLQRDQRADLITEGEYLMELRGVGGNLSEAENMDISKRLRDIQTALRGGAPATDSRDSMAIPQP